MSTETDAIRLRLSKMPLRRGILYSSAHPVDQRARSAAARSAVRVASVQLAFDSATETVLLAHSPPGPAGCRDHRVAFHE